MTCCITLKVSQTQIRDNTYFFRYSSYTSLRKLVYLLQFVATNSTNTTTCLLL